MTALHRPRRARLPFRALAISALMLVTALSLDRVPASPRPDEEVPAESDRGEVGGTVIDAATGKPVAGAYVGVGDFGDSGGSNYERHRRLGLHQRGETDGEGRFVLGSLAFTREDSDLKSHVLVVTHRDFAPHREEFRLPRGQAVEIPGQVVDITVRLDPAASVRVSVPEISKVPREFPVIFVLRALDGHRFIPAGRDPHLSAFASSTWQEVVKGDAFTFTQLRGGEYSIEVILRYAGSCVPFGLHYIGASRVRLEPGQGRETVIAHEDHGTHVGVLFPRPSSEAAKRPASNSPGSVFVLSRNVGLCVWDDGRARSPEDARLGRILREALLVAPLTEVSEVDIFNLPPASYCVFAGPAPRLRAVSFKLSPEEASPFPKLDLSVPEKPSEGRVRTDRLDRSVRIESRSYTLAEISGLMTKVTESAPRFEADPALREETIELQAGETSIWDVVEKLHVALGVAVEESGDDRLVLCPRR
jgi:hypothetical protein